MPVDSVPGTRPEVSRRKRRLTRVLKTGQLSTKPLVRTSLREGNNRADDVSYQPCDSEVFRLNEFTLGSQRNFVSSIRSYCSTRTKYRGMQLIDVPSEKLQEPVPVASGA